MKRVLLTGGAGFIGSHIAAHIIAQTDWNVTVLDRLDCSGNINRLVAQGLTKNPRMRFVYHDLRSPVAKQLSKQIGEHDYILHLAAGTHVDRSIEDALSFVYDNVVGTCNLLDYTRLTGCEKFLYFGTDEIFGPAPPGVAYKEWDRYKSSNPYSASKAGAEELVVAYHNTHKIPAIITHTMNVIGCYQHPEKFIPNTIGKVLRGELVNIFADPTCTQAGSRFYIDARDVALAVMFLLKHGEVGDKYNVVGAYETNNLSLATEIASYVGPLQFNLVSGGRPGYDMRYAMDGSKMAAMGWVPEQDIYASLANIVPWYLEHREWL